MGASISGKTNPFINDFEWCHLEIGLNSYLSNIILEHFRRSGVYFKKYNANAECAQRAYVHAVNHGDFC